MEMCLLIDWLRELGVLTDEQHDELIRRVENEAERERALFFTDPAGFDAD